MYVNVALNSRGRKPGEYPSGGPLTHLIDIWHAAAPAIDVLGVDIYDKGYEDWVENTIFTTTLFSFLRYALKTKMPCMHFMPSDITEQWGSALSV